MALTDKQYKFALVYHLTGNASEAYRQAYNASKMSNESVRVQACEIKKRPEVAAKIQELKEMSLQKHLVTVESITEELEEARQLALSDPKGAAAAVSASLGKARLYGLLTDKQQITGDSEINIYVRNYGN